MLCNQPVYTPDYLIDANFKFTKLSRIYKSYLDYNECLINNGNCSQICVNEIPGFHCECESGHILHPDGITCIGNAECSGNTVENFTCQCLPGYLDVDGTGFNCTGQQKYIALYCILYMIVNLVFFSDINECELPEINCDMNAQCANTGGSFDCTCNPGYFGNGTTCGKPSIVS